MQQVFHAGQWKKAEEVKLPISNRSFRYGDGLFETFRWRGNKWTFASLHWDRLSRGAKQLKLQLPSDLNAQIQSALLQLSTPQACRLNLWRAGAGKYSPSTNNIDWLLEATPLSTSTFNFSDTGLVIDIADTEISPNLFSAFKTNNALEYVLAGIEKTEKGLDDLIIKNCFGELAEACHSNIFLVFKDRIGTPPLRSGCLNGTIRRVLLEQKDSALPIVEKTLYPQDLENAKEIWLTSSLSGIRWVKRCGNLKFEHQLAEEYLVKLNQSAIL